MNTNQSGEFTLVGSRYLKRHLAEAGIGCNSTLLAAIVSKHLHGVATYQRYLAEQGPEENWTEFPPSCSPFQVQRVINGQSATRPLCVAVAIASTEVTGHSAPELATDPGPHIDRLHAQLLERVELVRSGRQSIDDLENPEEYHYAQYVPLKEKDIDAVQVTALSSSEAKIEAIFRDTAIQIGLILVSEHHHSVVYAPQPYRWTGSEVTVGRKKNTAYRASR